MSGEFIELLRRATDTDVRWHQLVMTNNVASIPPVNETPGDFVWNRGFNVVVVNRWGRPKFFCKCRGVGDAKLLHESRSMVSLRDVSPLRDLIPRVTEVHSGRIRVMATEFLSGTPLNGLLDGEFEIRKGRLVRRASEAISALSLHATSSLLNSPDDGVVELQADMDEYVSYLADVGLTDDEADTLRAALGDVSLLPRQLQHGDLWPANVIRHKDRLLFIDFEMFGNVQVPMYDVFHFLRTCTDAWDTGQHQSWTRRMGEHDAASILLRDCASAATRRLGLTPGQAVAALVYYIVHFSATTHRRNPDGAVWKTFFREVRALADALKGGCNLIDQFLGPSH